MASNAAATGATIKAVDFPNRYRYLTTETFTLASSNFDKADYSTGRFAKVRVQADGGGSGGCGATSGAQIAVSGFGGGGEYAEGWIDFDDLSASETVTVGQGGAAGTAGDNPGGTGTGSSFGSHITCIGGTGGTGGSVTGTGASNVETGGLGGTGGTFGGLVQAEGQLRVPGGDGANTQIILGVIVRTGHAGASHLGRARRISTSSDIVGAQGYNYGTGASPTISPISKATQAGALGGVGIVYVDIYV